jgi:3-hydroxyacyl-CoA dehydrogenase
MVASIQHVAVIGSGVMGMGIAAQCANAGLKVSLLDIVPAGAENRNMLAEGALAKALKTKPAPFTHAKRARLVTPGNLEDHTALLADADWIIEVVLEKLEVKHNVYRTIDAARKPGSIVSSNTSTLPLALLTQGMSEGFRRDFLITHFFNPPRYMRLLELICGPETSPEVIARIRAITDIRLGKGVVECKDTPGFIANRIGAFWLFAALSEALNSGITVEEADAVMGKPVGIPKTGVFGLYDLIGIDLMPLIAKSMLAALPATDRLHSLYSEPELVTKMIADGYTGRKGKGGFYRLNTEGGGKKKEAIDLKTGAYRAEAKASLSSVDSAKQGLRALVDHPDIGGKFAREVLLEVLAYSASLVPEIADDIVRVDEAMRLGYNWKYGPFELIDRLSTKDQSGAAWLAAELTSRGKTVPALLTAVGSGKFYDTKPEGRQFFTTASTYTPVPMLPDAWTLADITHGKEPLYKNPSARLWDIGDGVTCLEFTSKMNAVDTDTLKAIQKSLEITGKGYKGLVIGNDADNFCVGANLGMLLFCINTAGWGMIDDILTQGQQAMLAMKYAPFPVIGAVAGMALGGGCEIALHCDAVQAHVESYIGLVEGGVGEIPAWGGCTEMLLRAANAPKMPGGPMPAVSKTFELISMAKVSTSADDAQEFGFLNAKSRVTMNRARVLADAKSLCLEMAANYTPPARDAALTLPGPSGKAALMMAVEGFVSSGKATPHDAAVAGELATALTGGNADPTHPVTEQQLMDLERAGFIALSRTRPTQDRITYMLENGKPLRN